MTISLSKGGNISLSKEDPSLVRMAVGLGWDQRNTDGQEFDLDASLFMLGDDGKVRSDRDFIFYKQLNSACGAIEHTGDNRTGEGDGDDEEIFIDLSKVPADVQRLVVTVTIHDAEARRQNFGQVINAFMRVVNRDSGVEVARFDLSEDAGTEVAMQFGEIYRNGGDWKFKAVGQGHAGGLVAMCQKFGIDASA